ncbi:hypothetical protein [Thauera sp. SDU_THAU2]|uniref:hypothetical protein n=1 Tax=Thauera sp. SDU_THAU2 TaxID=3136633 RepID=UPI00311E987F
MFYMFFFLFKDKDVNSKAKSVDKSVKALKRTGSWTVEQRGQGKRMPVRRLSMVFPAMRFFPFVHKLSPLSTQNYPHP